MISDGTLLLRGLIAPDVAGRIASSLHGAPFADGRATAHGAAREAKNNTQLVATDPIAREHGATLVAALSRNELFKSAALPHTILPFMFARYEVGMAYGEHLDLPVVGTGAGPLRTDLSLTVFLSPPESYDGGELVMIEGAITRRIKGNAGDAFLYPSGTLHRVEPITRGERLVGVTWIQSLVRDSEERGLLLVLASAIGALQAAGAPEAELQRLRQVQHELVRRWTVC